MSNHRAGVAIGAAVLATLTACSSQIVTGSATTVAAGAPSGPAVKPVAPVGGAPTIRVDGNRFVDGHGREIRLLGVNYAGVEGACVDPGFQQGATDQHPGDVFDYPPGGTAAPGQPPQPDPAFFGLLAAWHVDAVRFMVNEMCWLGRPPNPRNNPPVAPIPQAHYGAAQYRQAIERFVGSLHRYGILAVPTLGDNPCPRNGVNPPGSQYSPCDDADQVMPDADNAPDFWRSFAATFRNDHSMVFELFNEPHPEAKQPIAADDPWACWINGCDIPGEGWHAAGMQQLIDAIRSSGASQPILVPGINYSSNLYRPPYGGGPAVGWLIGRYRPHDPLVPAQLAAANHLYDDTYDSTDLGCPHGSTPDCWDHRLGIVAAQVPVVTTELGEHDCDTSSAFVDSYMDWADKVSTSGRGKVSYLLWTFNSDYSCNDANATLVTDSKGTPNVSGRALIARLTRNHGR